MMFLFKQETKLPATLCNKRKTRWSFYSWFFHFIKKNLKLKHKRLAFNVTSSKDNGYVLILKTQCHYSFCFLTFTPITYYKIMYHENEINWIYSFKTNLQILHNHINNMILHNLMTQMDWTKRHLSGLYFIFW